MEQFTILQELWESDSVIFALMGCAAAIWIGSLRKQSGRHLLGAIISAAVYAVCEILSGIHTGCLPAIKLLFVGTAAVGSCIGCLLVRFTATVRKKAISHGCDARYDHKSS